MIRIRALLSVFALSLFLSGHSVAAADKSRDEIDHFNQNLIQLHLNMDHAGILAL